jgi:hypothetical protein
MNPKIEYASVLWNTLDPNVPVEVAKLKLEQALGMGFVITGVRVDPSTKSNAGIAIYNNLIQTAVQLQRTMGVIDYGPLGFLQYIDEYYAKVNPIYQHFDPKYRPGEIPLNWMPFKDLDVNEFTLGVVTDIYNHVFNHDYIQVLQLK